MLQMADLIDRQRAINAVERNACNTQRAIDAINGLPSEIRPIGYQDCSNAMLMMWMDNVVTDGEYNRIMDKLNAHWGKKDG